MDRHACFCVNFSVDTAEENCSIDFVYTSGMRICYKYAHALGMRIYYRYAHVLGMRIYYKYAHVLGIRIFIGMHMY